MAHSKGNWTIGKTGGTVVTDSDEGFPANTGHSGKENTDYYGGNLIAESILRIEDAKVIAAAPKMLKALKAAKAVFDAQGIDENHSIVGEQYKEVIEAIKATE